MQVNIDSVKRTDIQEYAFLLQQERQSKFFLTDSEKMHLQEFYCIGLLHSDNQNDYNSEIDKCIESWYLNESNNIFTFVDFEDHLLNTVIKRNQELDRSIQGDASIMKTTVPFFFVLFGMIVCSLACVFSTIFILGFFTRFLFNPFLIAIIIIGFWGLFATDLAAYIEWRKQNNVKT